MAFSPPKERLILISLSATNLETQKEVALLISITRHLFCLTGRLRWTQAIKSNRLLDLRLLDFRELSSRTTQTHRKNIQLVLDQRRCSHELPFLHRLGFLESIYWSLILKCQNTSQNSHPLPCSWSLWHSPHSTLALWCPVAEWCQSCRCQPSST